ncbi:sporulation/spore germination protein [Fischerella muscicola CCMEE 5323]|uniref:Sporulation/spore germination protein n=1 Tax=Fischerella muscicola CCMEE 5323 TaxID=2019572 RepID=A0A2N6K6C3_FISMU|nr:GerMN domain-containing protein [Fischerella muscicola]PLZ92430.1 sporulation/spore germination protein [Fischerella muscicola CCMEE 5323]
MNKIINTSKKYIVSVIFVAITASLSSCSSNPTYEGKFNITTSPTPNSETPAPATQSPSQSTAKLNVQPRSESPTTDKTVNVTLYTSDTQCQELVPQTVTLPAQEPVTAAVGKILEQRDNGDFSFSGYRVNIKNGVATVDFRLDPKSQRQITSLSSCEQFALFGSLRKTLTSNPQWGIKDVRFTERGEEIVL